MADKTNKQKIEVIKVSRAGKLAKTLSNETAQKILNYIKKNKESTASLISKKLKLAPSTVHYNLQALMKVGVICGDSFHYSDKGREVIHYELTNKVIVILPEEESSMWSQLKLLLPGLLSLAAVAVLGIGAWLFGASRSMGSSSSNFMDLDIAASSGAAKDIVVDATSSSAPIAYSETVTEIASTASSLDMHSLLIGVAIATGAILIGALLYLLLKRTPKR